MKSFIPALCLAAMLLSLLHFPAVASAGSVVTLFIDGAVVERSESARKGYIEILLPLAARTNSLKIKPKPGTTINRVVIKPRKPAKGREQEIASILERQELLNDRIKALSVREEIFKSAAKSQSAKAPRRSKSNPEPMAAIRQGTDYAIAQLETVYTGKRKAEKELKLLDEKKALLEKGDASGGNYAKIWVSPANGSVTASWSQIDRSWAPSYELRGEAAGRFGMYLVAGEFSRSKGEKVVLNLSSLAAPASAGRYGFAEDGSSVRLSELKISRLQQEVPEFPALEITSDAKIPFPPGEISCYRDGAYIGAGRFPGLETGKSIEFRCINR